MIVLDNEETVHFELEEDFDGMEYPEKSKYGWAYNRIPLTNQQWFYVVGMQGVGAGIVNFFVNLFLAWLMYPKDEGATIVFSGKLTCIFSDIVMTSFLLPTITCILGSFMVTLDIRKGKLMQPIDERWLMHPYLAWIPTGINYKIIIKRAIMFGVMGIFVFSIPTLPIVYYVTKQDGYMILKWSFYIFKGVWCMLMAMIVSPIITFILAASFNPRHTFFS